MSTQTNSTSPLQGLTPADRELLNLAIAHNLNLRSLIGGPSSHKDSSAPTLALNHPARADLLSFAEWFAQPHISAAADFLVAALTHIDTLSQNLSFKTLRAGLETAFQSVLSFAATLPHSPENAIQGNRIYRESRLIASTIKRFTPSLCRQSRSTSPPDTESDVSNLSSLDRAKASLSFASRNARDPHHTRTTSKSALSPAARVPLSHPAPVAASHATSPQVQSAVPQPQALDDLAHRFIRAHGIRPALAAKLLTTVNAALPHPKPPLLIQRNPFEMLTRENQQISAASKHTNTRS